MKILYPVWFLFAGLAFAVPAPQLFDTAWADRTPFENDLVDPSVLNDSLFDGASVYHIAFDLTGDTITGAQEILYTNRTGQTLGDLVLHLYPNLLGSALRVNELRLDGTTVPFTLERSNSILRAPLPKGLESGSSVVISTDFALDVTRDVRESYGRLARYKGYADVLSLAHAYPTVAVFEDGAWDTRVPPSQGDPLYAETAFFLVKVRAPAARTLVASGAAVTRELEGKTQEVVFAAGPVRDFYLVSGDYIEQHLSIGEVTIRSYAPADLTEGSWRGLQYARDAVQTFEDEFGPYPYRELDIVAVPVTAGGIEFPGIFNVSNPYYEQPGGFFETIVVHETAHQWFFGLVGNNQLTEPWLDEALAQYATLRYYGAVRGEESADAFRRYLQASWTAALRRDIPIGRPVDSYSELTYSAIVYGRGPLFFEALADEVGQETLSATLRDYVQTYAYRVADTEGFKDVAEENCGCDLTPLFETWIYDTSP